MARPRKVERVRRPRGAGTEYEDKRRGVWVKRWTAPDGRKLYREARDYEALMAKVREAEGKLPQDTDDTTVAEWFELWLDVVLPAANTLPAATITHYRMISRRVLPSIGKVHVARLTALHIDGLMRDLNRRYMPATVAATRAVLSGALKEAAKKGMFPRGNPMHDAVRVPTGEPVQDPLSEAEANLVLRTARARGPIDEALAQLALHGLRGCELRGLRWISVDLTAGTVQVLRETTKSQSSVRSVPLSADAHLALRRWRMASRFSGEPHHVFTTNGGPVGRPWCRRRWQGITEAAGLGARRLHASRHTAGTVLVNNGVALEVVQDLLGHSDISITRGYAVVGSGLTRAAIDTLGAALSAAESR